jgi:hypothetical protein
LDDFEKRIAEITTKFDPQVLFAESVGSCADLVATVIKPLANYHKTSTHPASLSVFTDSRLLLRYLRGMELPFSEGIIYIFEKQIEEASLLIANKIDLLSSEDVQELIQLGEQRYPEKLIRLQNSLDVAQVAEWLALIQTQTRFLPDQSLNIDYDTYAEGESHFAWVDRHLQLTFSVLPPGNLVGEMIMEIVKKISRFGLHIGHLKFLINEGNQAIKISITSQDDLDEKFKKELSKLSILKTNQITILINAMIEGNAVLLEEVLDNIIKEFCNKNRISFIETARFSRVPGYPTPSLRIGN